jgi:hypothetical protein
MVNLFAFITFFNLKIYVILWSCGDFFCRTNTLYISVEEILKSISSLPLELRRILIKSINKLFASRLNFMISVVLNLKKDGFVSKILQCRTTG